VTVAAYPINDIVPKDSYDIAVATIRDRKEGQALAAAASGQHPEVAQDLLDECGLSRYICVICGSAQRFMIDKPIPYAGHNPQICNACSYERIDLYPVTGKWNVLPRPKKVHR